jgi:AbrB family looped-hinge helix DNA binding protein
MFYFLTWDSKNGESMRVTSKGQVTIPKRYRDRTGIKPGSEVEFSQRGETVIVRRRKEQTHQVDPDAEFDAYLDSVTGIVDLGMTTDEYMEFLRGE